MQHHSAPPPSLKEATLGTAFPKDLELVVAKLLEKRPRDRYQNLLDLSIDLNRIKAGEPVELGVHKLSTGSHRSVSQPLLKGTALLIGLAMITGIGYQLGRMWPQLGSQKDSPSVQLDHENFLQMKTHFDKLPVNRAPKESGFFSQQISATPDIRLFRFPKNSVGRILNADERYTYRLVNGALKHRLAGNTRMETSSSSISSLSI